MKLWRGRCPSPTALERAFWSNNSEIESHAGECARCGLQWEEMAAFAEHGKAIQPSPVSDHRREEIRTALLSKEKPSEPEPAPRRPWLGFGWQLAAAASALALAWWLWPSDGSSPIPSERRSSVLEHDGARYMVAATQPDEIVRLVDGTLTIDVASLADKERFRVIVGDTEIEASETAFDVSAKDDRLLKVRVMRGEVAVHGASAENRVLKAGDTWNAPEPIDEPDEPVHKPMPVADPLETAGFDSETAVREAVDAGAVSAAATASRAPAPAPARTVARVTQPAKRSAPRRNVEQPVPEPTPPAVEIQTAPDAGAVKPLRSAAQQAFDEGWNAIRSGDFDAAAEAFERAASASGNIRVEEDALYWRSVALARAGHQLQAAQAFERFLDSYPDSARAGEASVMLGWLLFELGDYSHAERRFRAAAGDPSARVQKSADEGLNALRKMGR